MDDIYNTLNSYLKGSSKNGINETVAEFMLFYLNDIPELKASDVAERCHTSTPSVIRFCREIGCEGYADFKEIVTRYLENVQEGVLVPRAPLRPLGSKKEYTDSIRQWTHQMQEYARIAMTEIDQPQLISLAGDILKYQHVYIFGMGMAALAAEQLRIRLARCGKLIITMNTLRMDTPLSSNRENTLGIVISQQGRMINANGCHDACDYLNKNCGRTWLVTQLPPGHHFSFDKTLYIRFGPSYEISYHTMIYFEELLEQESAI